MLLLSITSLLNKGGVETNSTNPEEDREHERLTAVAQRKIMRKVGERAPASARRFVHEILLRRRLEDGTDQRPAYL